MNENSTNPTILLVEDDKFMRTTLTRRLQKEGFLVEEAIDGNEGIQKIGTINPDVILLDLILPGIDGFQVLEQLQQQSEKTVPPVIVLSNLGQEEDVQRALGLGAKSYMVKAHFTPAEITGKIREVLAVESQD